MTAATTASARTDPADRSRQALWAALGLIVLWGANFSVQKAVFLALSPGGFLFVRYLIMPVAAAALLCLRFGTRWPRLSRGDAFALLRLGLIGHLLHVGLVTYGIHWSTAFSSSLILACGPVFTLLILHWHGHEALTRGSVAGVAVACVGVIVFLSDKLFGG
ncbi:MAG: DMT family transporter, partial [Caldimonas sp.]